LYHQKYDSAIRTSVALFQFDNSTYENRWCSIDDTRYDFPKRYWLTSTDITRQTNSIWQTISIPIENNFKNGYFAFKASIYVDANITADVPPDQAHVMIDNVSLTGINNLLPPANIRVTNNQGFVSLTWDKVTGAKEYIVYRSEYPDKDFIAIARVDKKIHGTQEIQNYYSDVIRKPGNVFVPAVDNFEKPYYYKIATVVEINLKLRSNK
jgi:hypothetical protein